MGLIFGLARTKQAALRCRTDYKPETSMDLRLAATTLAILTALMSIALADHDKDMLPEPVSEHKAQPIAQGSAQARPIRVILPASWEPNNGQAAAQSTK